MPIYYILFLSLERPRGILKFIKGMIVLFFFCVCVQMWDFIFYFKKKKRCERKEKRGERESTTTMGEEKGG